MARSREFTQQNTALATQAANVGMNWFHQIAEQNFKQCKASLEELLGLNLRMAADFGNKRRLFARIPDACRENGLKRLA